MNTIHISDALVAKLTEHSTQRGLEISLDELCEQLLLRTLAEETAHTFQAPSEDAVKERLQALGYID